MIGALLLSLLSADNAAVERMLNRSAQTLKTGLLTVCDFQREMAVDNLVFSNSAYQFLRIPANTMKNPKAIFVSSWREKVALRGGKYRMTLGGVRIDGREFPGEQNISFDGQLHWDWKSNKRHVDLSLGQSVPKPVQDWFGDCLGYGRSIEPRSLFKDFPGPHRLDEAVKGGRYSVLRESEQIGDLQCILLQCESLDRVWLAKDRGYGLAMRESQWHADGPLRLRITNSDFRNLGNDFWLPFQTRVELFGHPAKTAGKLCAVYVGKVVEAQLNPPNELFDFLKELPSGTVMRNNVNGEVHVLSRNADGSIVKHPLSEKPNRPNATLQSAGRMIYQWWFWAGTAAVIIAIVLLLLRRQQTSR